METNKSANSSRLNNQLYVERIVVSPGFILAMFFIRPLRMIAVC